MSVVSIVDVSLSPENAGFVGRFVLLLLIVLVLVLVSVSALSFISLLHIVITCYPV